MHHCLSVLGENKCTQRDLNFHGNQNFLQNDLYLEFSLAKGRRGAKKGDFFFNAVDNERRKYKQQKRERELVVIKINSRVSGKSA